ncbi:MAG: hypothetical protein DMG07_18160 [Acidobacteria bacterium]|nr:MAG: hypothetical protein DMG07_18160 [Acidobacteriota bacterium]
MNALGALLSDAFDYAGLFPPAGLPLSSAVAEYAACRRGPHAWALGRFVLPLSRREQFERHAPQEAWRLTVLAGPDLEAELSELSELRRRRPETAVEAVELKVASEAEIERASRVIPRGLTAYCELPVAAASQEILGCLARVGARAKLRTGGLTAESFPSPADLARCLVACRRAGVGFKATAGLHHALRGTYPLGYEPGSPKAMMHGFLNLAVAAVLVYHGLGAGEAEELLAEEEPSALRFDGAGIAWRSHRLARSEVIEARQNFVFGFGSCSFREPIQELEALGLS